MDRMLFPGFSLSEAGRLYARSFEKRSRNLALDFAQCRALLVLAENEGVTQQRLSELTAIASPWLVRILDRLEAMGLAERRPRLADRRARSLAITADARAMLPLLRNIVGESMREALRGLSTDEMTILVKALDRVIANLSVIDRHSAVAVESIPTDSNHQRKTTATMQTMTSSALLCGAAAVTGAGAPAPSQLEGSRRRQG
jgi:MarR family transcriptional regulator, transcriptional regulator for hemolysin